VVNDADHTLKLELKDIRPPSNKRPVLVVLQGQPIGLALQLDKDRVTIGRGSLCDIVLRDEVASRHHAEIYQLAVEAGCVEYYVNDLGSTNGTYLNGQFVNSGQLLQDGDKIKVGNHLLKFALLDEFEAEFQERLHQMTQTDELTGLRSRRSLFADLDRIINQAVSSREEKPISVIMLDLDRFKLVNDGRGHLVGSHMIRDVGHIIRDVVGGVDRAARYGGEEYLAYVLGSIEEGVEVAENIRKGVESHAFSASPTDSSQTMRITISAGVSSFPIHGISALDLVQKADQALYRAKRSGRNQTCIFDESMDKPDTAHPMVDASAIIYGPADAQ
jgi:diguanylate cyclase (GGDEF)-like protein